MKPRVIGKIVGGVGRAPAQSRVDSDDYYKSVTRVEKEYRMNEISREVQERLQLAEKQHEELTEALGNMRYKKDFTFSLVVSAIDLDDAIAQLRAAGHDVDDLKQVRWLD